MPDKIELRRGLKDVYLDRSSASFIDGAAGKLVYRGYNIDDLAEKSNFVETIYLLLHGKLPTQKELDEFDATLRVARPVPREVIDVIRLTQNAHPMDVLRTAVSALGAFDPETEDNSIEATLRKGARLTAQAPTIVAAHHRIRTGHDPVTPDLELDHAANFLYMLFDQEPDPFEAKLLDKDFLLHAEHGSNASAFGARVAASTFTDLHSAVVAGIGVLKGPWHGGAAEKVMNMALDIGSEENAASYTKKVLEDGGRIMGFGHRVYRTVDPRSVHLREEVRILGERKGQPKWLKILTQVEEVMKPYASKGICVNVDFFSGAMYHLMEIPEDLFISIFAMGRVPGWTVQVMEQLTNNILIRPLLLYNGPMDLEYVSISERG